MIVRRAIHFITIFTGITFSGILYAQTCSGGNEGGMDATGNQCNVGNSEVSDSPGAERVARSVPKMVQRRDPANKEWAASPKATNVQAAPIRHALSSASIPR